MEQDGHQPDPKAALLPQRHLPNPMSRSRREALRNLDHFSLMFPVSGVLTWPPSTRQNGSLAHAGSCAFDDPWNFQWPKPVLSSEEKWNLFGYLWVVGVSRARPFSYVALLWDTDGRPTIFSKLSAIHTCCSHSDPSSACISKKRSWLRETLRKTTSTTVSLRNRHCIQQLRKEPMGKQMVHVD